MQSWHLSLKLAKFQSMFILVIQCTWQEVTENSPNALIKYQITKLDHYFWNLIYTKTHLSLSKNKI